MFSKGWSQKVQSSYGQKDKDAGTYNNSEWVEKQKLRIDNLASELEVSKKRNYIIIDIVRKTNKDNITILDFGGGLGLSYHPLKASTDKKLDYNIVEVSKVVEAGRELYKNHNELSFYSNLIDVKKEIDLCYIRTSLQYVASWKDTLEKISKLSPSKIVLADTAAGSIETFMTYQFWGKEKIPYWFISTQDIIEHMSSLGYNCVDKHDAQNIEKNKSFSGLKKYPEKNRIKTLINFTFEKNEN